MAINRKDPTRVRRDQYGIINNPSIDIMQEEFDRISEIQKEQIKENGGITNKGMETRQFKINILEKELLK